jgi:glutaredoxin-related protein
VLALTGDQNIAIRELSKLVLDRDWVNYQRLSLKQLQHFCELRDHDPKQTRAASPKRKNGLGGN